MTPRVLHLLHLSAGEEPTLACRAALDIPGFTHELWTIGPASAAADAWPGLDSHPRLTPPLGNPLLAWRASRALARDRRRRNAAPDLVQCWSPSAYALARTTFGRYTPVVVLATTDPTHRTVDDAHPSWSAGSLLRMAPTTVVMRLSHWEAWLHVGAGDVRLLPPPVPAPPASPAGAPARRDLRRMLGIDAADDATTVAVGLLADPAPTGDARRFSFIMGLLHTVGRRVVGVVPRGCGVMRPAARFVRAHGRRWGLVESPLPMTAIAHAIDAAVWPGRHGGAALAAAYAAAGVPVVCADSADEIAAAVAHIPGAVPPVAARDAEMRSIAASLLPLVEAATSGSRATPAADHRSAPAGPSFQSVLAEIWRERLSPPGTNPFRAAAHPLTGATAR